jgi:hypothetical protein
VQSSSENANVQLIPTMYIIEKERIAMGVEGAKHRVHR